jgi:OOP family OmpA-OmpF porin
MHPANNQERNGQAQARANILPMSSATMATAIYGETQAAAAAAMKPRPARRRAPRLLASLLLGGALLLGSGTATAGPDYELGILLGAHLWNPDHGLGYLGPQSRLGHGVDFGVRLGLGLHPRFTLEGELAVLPTETSGEPATPASTVALVSKVTAVGYRLHGLVHLLTGRVRPYVLVGAGGLSSTSSDPNVSLPATTYTVDGGLGLKVDVRPSWGLRIEGKVLLMPGNPSAPPIVPSGDATLGLYGRFGATKPPPPPLPPDGDADSDGITNAADACPEQAGPPVQKGCAVAPGDADGDGIADALDKCPLQAEVKNDWQDDDGCPDTAPPPALRGVIGPLVGVSFVAEQAEPTPASYPALDRVLQALLASPGSQIELAAVPGSAGPGRELLQKRADAVKAYLVAKGVEPSRLHSKAAEAGPATQAPREPSIELRLMP